MFGDYDLDFKPPMFQKINHTTNFVVAFLNTVYLIFIFWFGIFGKWNFN